MILADEEIAEMKARHKREMKTETKAIHEKYEQRRERIRKDIEQLKTQGKSRYFMRLPMKHL